MRAEYLGDAKDLFKRALLQYMHDNGMIQLSELSVCSMITDEWNTGQQHAYCKLLGVVHDHVAWGRFCRPESPKEGYGNGLVGRGFRTGTASEGSYEYQFSYGYDQDGETEALDGVLRIYQNGGLLSSEPLGSAEGEAWNGELYAN
jgi:hypothetical protein